MSSSLAAAWSAPRSEPAREPTRSGMPAVPTRAWRRIGGTLTAIRRKGAMMAEPESDKMDIEAIMRQLPHRYPFLLVDRVLKCEAGQYIHAVKNVTFNEPYFPGHFPHRPLMPGVMIIEALAQAAGIPRLPDRRSGARRGYSVLFRCNRQCPLPQTGRARRPAAAQSRVEARLQGNLEISLRRRSRRVRGGLGRNHGGAGDQRAHAQPAVEQRRETWDRRARGDLTAGGNCCGCRDRPVQPDRARTS